QVRQWGIRRTRKSVVPLKQQAVTRRFAKLSPKSGRSKSSQPLRKRTRQSRFFCGAKGDDVERAYAALIDLDFASILLR
ncbi:MAG: hypothetical protein ACOVLE_03170, partial [Pirellula staleyi]